jgi:hypothetical protein
MRIVKPLKERFLRHVSPEPNTGCWLWIGASYSNGYGTIDNTGAHRVSFEIYNGKIPEGMQVLHRCDVRPCVNPEHLFLGDRFINMRDMNNKKRGKNSRKTHCLNGHELTQENIYQSTFISRGSRQCKKCRKDIGKQ